MNIHELKGNVLIKMRHLCYRILSGRKNKKMFLKIELKSIKEHFYVKKSNKS
jgi:hypothetical protein